VSEVDLAYLADQTDWLVADFEEGKVERNQGRAGDGSEDVECVHYLPLLHRILSSPPSTQS
jgi:hypothetical protein